jgi:hypothetical protein
MFAISWNLESYLAIGCAVCPGTPLPGWDSRDGQPNVGGAKVSHESTKVPEGHLPRETELVRNQITISDIANGIVGILEGHMKVKNR